MQWNIRYPKDMLRKANGDGSHILSIGYYAAGRGEAQMFLDEEQITTLWVMAHEMNHHGKTAREALEVVERRMAEHRAKMAARAEAAHEAIYDSMDRADMDRQRADCPKSRQLKAQQASEPAGDVASEQTLTLSPEMLRPPLYNGNRHLAR